VALGDPIGGPWHGAGRNQHRRSVVGTEEAHKMRLGKSHEGLTTGPHVAASERERKKWAADTCDREGIGVHLTVAHRERERERESRWSGLTRRVGSGPAR
jgi:hypothetical protein